MDVNKMISRTRTQALFLTGLVVLAPLLLTGCVSIHPSCSSHGSTAISVGKTIQYNVDQGDNHITNWTHARITTVISIGKTDVGRLNHTYTNQFVNSSRVSLQFNQSAGYNRIHHIFAVGTWTPFTVTLSVISNDTALAGYTYFNGSNTVSGQIRCREIGQDNSNTVYDITLSKDYPNVSVDVSGYKVNLRSADWSYEVIALKFAPLTC